MSGTYTHSHSIHGKYRYLYHNNGYNNDYNTRLNIAFRYSWLFFLRDWSACNMRTSNNDVSPGLLLQNKETDALTIDLPAYDFEAPI